MANEAGYLSDRDKKRFTIVAGVLGFVFFILEFLVPMVAVFATMPFSMFGGFRVVTFDSSGLAWHNGHVYAVESSQENNFSRQQVHTRLVRNSPAGLESVADLGDWQPSLLTTPSSLYLVSGTTVGQLENDRLERIVPSESLGDISRPFLLAGAPAVVESRPNGRRLLRWTGADWQKLANFPGSVPRNCTQYLAPADHLLEFQCQHGSLYVLDRSRPDGDWKLVTSGVSKFFTFAKDGEPAVVSSTSSGKLSLLTLKDDRWRVVRTAESHSALVSELAAFARPDSDVVVVVLSDFPGTLRVNEWSDTGLKEVFRERGTFPFPTKMFGAVWAAQLSPILLSLLLAVILSGLMRAHRIVDYEVGGLRVPFASLTRRALAQLVDLVFVAVPLLALGVKFFGHFEDFFETPTSFVWIFVWIAVVFGWALLVFLAFSLSEGWRGVTPGKWLVGIRVAGTDLKPCGFTRALVRNLLKFVDGFFNFLVGLLLVAFTPDWQRLGDLAARTVVIHTGREGLHGSTQA